MLSCLLFNKSYSFGCKQVAEILDHKAVIMHASKGLEPGTHERLSTILEEEIPAELRSDIVVVSDQITLKKQSFVISL